MTKRNSENPLFVPRWMINEIRKQGGDPHAMARGYGFSHCEPYKPVPPMPPVQLEQAPLQTAIEGSLTVTDWREVVLAAAALIRNEEKAGPVAGPDLSQPSARDGKPET